MIPTRGQIIAAEVTVPPTRSLSLPKEGSWSNGGEEYWFPRPNSTSTSATIILGGGRRAARQAEQYVFDDSVVNPYVGEALRAFFPRTFSGIEMKVKVMMEWVSLLSIGIVRLGCVDIDMLGRPVSWGSQQRGIRWWAALQKDNMRLLASTGMVCL